MMKQLLPLIFLFVFLGILVLSNYYLSKRFSWFFSIESTKTLFATFVFFSLYMMVGLLVFSNTTSMISSVLYVLAAILMGIFLYFLLSVLLIDIVRLFTSFSPRSYGIIAVSLTVVISVYGLLNARNLQITKQEIAINGLSENVKAMHLTDLHVGHFRGKKYLQRIVDKTNEQDVDVVFITGDLFDGRINLSKETLSPLVNLDAPVYFVEGNHDGYTGVKRIKNLLRELGIHVLENEVLVWKEIQVVGLNHMIADNRSYNMHAAIHGSTIEKTLEDLEIAESKPSILLHHSPDGITYANKHGIDLYLAGHTHAGQLFPIKYIANLIFKYNKGLFDFKGTKLYVSQGSGTFGPPMRVGTISEMALISLKPIN